MKDFIIIGAINKIYQKFMVDDISRTVFINCKSKEKYDNNDTREMILKYVLLKIQIMFAFVSGCQR